MLKSKILRFADSAKDIALTIDRPHKHVSFIFHRGKIVSVGTNRRKTHPMAIKLGYRFDEPHSELSALINLPKNFLGCNLTLVNFRYNNQGQMRMSKPCYKCMSWIPTHFKEVWYTTNNGIIKYES